MVGGKIYCRNINKKLKRRFWARQNDTIERQKWLFVNCIQNEMSTILVSNVSDVARDLDFCARLMSPLSGLQMRTMETNKKQNDKL